jgi:predicted SprT family Zn-dependent metalloprotease
MGLRTLKLTDNRGHDAGELYLRQFKLDLKPSMLAYVK